MFVQTVGEKWQVIDLPINNYNKKKITLHCEGMNFIFFGVKNNILLLERKISLCHLYISGILGRGLYFS